MAHFSHRDLSDTLALVRAVSSVSDGSDPFPERVLAQLLRLIPGEFVGYHEREICSHRLLMRSHFPELTSPSELDEGVAAFCCEHPPGVQVWSKDTSALKMSDFASPRPRGLAYYDYAAHPQGVEFQMRMWLDAPPGIARYFFINRLHEDGDFSERDRDLLELLGPFLNASRERFDEPDLRCVDELTEREAEIMSWVARGKTNKEIAELLVMSPHTVRKHLEHTFEKLRVHTRTAAIARAFPTGDRDPHSLGWLGAALATQSAALLC